MYDLVDRPVEQLPTFERTTLTGLRRWVHAASMAGARGVGANDPFSRAMRLIDRQSSDDLPIGRPCEPTVGESEAVLVALWRLVRGGERGPARRLARLIVGEGGADPLVAAVGASLA